MNGNIKNYLAGIGPSLPLEIISEDTYRRLNKIADLFEGFAASEYIMETSLNTGAAEVDFSFRVLTEEKTCLSNGFKSNCFSTLADDGTWMRIKDFVNFWPQSMDDIWFEIDYGECGQDIPQPCFFFNAGKIKKGRDIDDELLFESLKHLLNPEQLQELRDNMIAVIQALPLEVGLFQVGVMLARSRESIRIFTEELSREQVVEYLSAIGWSSSFSRLDELFQLVHPYSDAQYILDFDVSSQGISEKIGINFGLKNGETLPAFLDNLVQNHLCTDVKKQGVLSWSGSQGSYLGRDYGYCALIKNISHFKIACSPDEGFKAKAYLRVAGVYLKDLWKPKAPTQPNAAEQRGKMEQPGYKEMQNVFKQIAQKAMLDKEYRELCLKDSKAAIQQIITSDAVIPDNIIFLEEDGNCLEHGFAYVLPPFLKPSWLLSK